MLPMILILIVTLILIFVGCFLIGVNTAKDNNNALNMKKHLTFMRAIVLGYIIFTGCFQFPISSKPFPLDFTKLYLMIISYGMIGVGFARIYKDIKKKKVYLIALILTIVGMGCRYILEYGEVSNTYNFTATNIILYIVIVPIFIVMVYWCSRRYLLNKKLK